MNVYLVNQSHSLTHTHTYTSPHIMSATISTYPAQLPMVGRLGIEEPALLISLVLDRVSDLCWNMVTTVDGIERRYENMCFRIHEDHLGTDISDADAVKHPLVQSCAIQHVFGDVAYKQVIDDFIQKHRPTYLRHIELCAPRTSPFLSRE